MVRLAPLAFLSGGTLFLLDLRLSVVGQAHRPFWVHVWSKARPRPISTPDWADQAALHAQGTHQTHQA